MSRVIDELEKEQMKPEFPDFSPGDTIVVQVRVKEGERERLQAYEGVVIAKRNRGLNSSFTVRKVSHGEGVERVFQVHSPAVAGVKIRRRGDVRRAKLYYLRQRSGKSARIKERFEPGRGGRCCGEREPVTVHLAARSLAAGMLISCLLGGCTSMLGSIAAGTLSATILNQDDPALVESGVPAYMLLVDGMISRTPTTRICLPWARSFTRCTARDSSPR